MKSSCIQGLEEAREWNQISGTTHRHIDDASEFLVHLGRGYRQISYTLASQCMFAVIC